MVWFLLLSYVCLFEMSGSFVNDWNNQEMSAPGPDGSRRVDTAAPPPKLNNFFIGNNQPLPIKDHDQALDQEEFY